MRCTVETKIDVKELLKAILVRIQKGKREAVEKASVFLEGMPNHEHNVDRNT